MKAQELQFQHARSQLPRCETDRAWELDAICALFVAAWIIGIAQFCIHVL